MAACRSAKALRRNTNFWGRATNFRRIPPDKAGTTKIIDSSLETDPIDASGLDHTPVKAARIESSEADRAGPVESCDAIVPIAMFEA